MAKPDEHKSLQPLEIGSNARWAGWTSWLLFLLAVAGILAWLLVRVTRSFWLAIGLVVFMLGYMLIAGYWASWHRHHR